MLLLDRKKSLDNKVLIACSHYPVAYLVLNDLTFTHLGCEMLGAFNVSFKFLFIYLISYI